MTAAPLVRVIGVGQRYRGDDAVGLLVAEQVRKLAPDGVDVLTASSDALALLAAFEDVAACIAIDSAQRGGAPGAVLRLEADAVAATRAGAATSSHGNALAEAVALGAALGSLPRHLCIIAIVGTAFGIGDEVTAPVRAAIPAAVAAVLAEAESECMKPT
jgi:hydrogenase maturation protease